MYKAIISEKILWNVINKKIEIMFSIILELFVISLCVKFIIFTKKK
jgi:hypothetical protein